MATVTVEINGRPYAVGCADGQEERVRTLAAQFDATVRQVGADVGAVGDIRLFLMAALILADELHEARAQAKAGNGTAAPVVSQAAPEPGLAEALNAIASRVEKMAAAI